MENFENFVAFDLSRNLFWFPFFAEDGQTVTGGHWQQALPSMSGDAAQFVVFDTLSASGLPTGQTIAETLFNTSVENPLTLSDVAGQTENSEGSITVSLPDGSEVEINTIAVQNGSGDSVAVLVTMASPSGDVSSVESLSFTFETAGGDAVQSNISLSNSAFNITTHPATGSDSPGTDSAMTHTSDDITDHMGHDMALKMLMPLLSDGMADTVTPSHSAAQTGDWFDPIIWGGADGDWGAIPAFGALVHIPAGMSVTYDFGSDDFAAYSTATGQDVSHVFMIRVDGDLTIGAEGGADTQIIVDTVFSTDGTHMTGLSSFNVDAGGVSDGTVDVVFSAFDIDGNQDILPDYYSGNAAVYVDASVIGEIRYDDTLDQYAEDADGNPLAYDFVYVNGREADDVANVFDGEDADTWLTEADLIEGYAGVRAAADHQVVLFNRDADAAGAEATLDVFFHIPKDTNPIQSSGDISDTAEEVAIKRADFLSEADLDAGWRFVERDDMGHPTRMETIQNNTTLPQTHAQDVDTALVLAMENDPSIKDWFRLFSDGDGDYSAPGVLGRHEWDPEQLSLGLVAQGEVDIQGQEKSAHIKLIADPFDANQDQPIKELGNGNFEINLSQAPSNWAVGDSVVLTSPKLSSRSAEGEDKELFDFQTTIVSINGGIVVVQGGADIADFALDAVAHEGVQLTLGNLTRSVTFRSDTDDFRSTYWAGGEGEDATYQKDQFGSIGDGDTATTVAELGHIMVMHQTGANISNVELINLGRTDKSALIDDFQAGTDIGGGGERSGLDIPYLVRDDGDLPADFESILNMRGRYALHLHQTGGTADTDDDAVLSGNVVNGGAGWGFVQHGSEAYLFNNIAYDLHGAGFVAETGDETGIWAGNLAVHMDGAAERFKGLDEHVIKTNDVARDGEGFWMEGRALAVFSNTAANVTGDAFAFESFGSDQVPIDVSVFDYYQIAFDQYATELAALGHTPEAFEGLSDIHAADGALGHNAYAPIRFFVDNQAFAASRAALSIVNTNIHGQRKYNDAWSVIEDFQSVNSHTGVFQLYASKYFYDNVSLLNDALTEQVIRDEGGNEFAMTLQASSAEAIWIDPTIIGYDENDQMAHSTRTGTAITAFGKQFNPEVKYTDMVENDGTGYYGLAAFSEAWEGLVNWDSDGDGIDDQLNAYHNFFDLNIINSTGDAFPDFNPRQWSDQYIWAAQIEGGDVKPQYIEGTESFPEDVDRAFIEANGTKVENVKYWRTEGTDVGSDDTPYQTVVLPEQGAVSIQLYGTSADEGIVALNRGYLSRTDWDGSDDEARILSNNILGAYDKNGATTATDDLLMRVGNDDLPVLFGTQEWEDNDFFIHPLAKFRLEDEKNTKLGRLGDDEPYSRDIYSGAIVEFDKTDTLGTVRYHYDDIVVLRNTAPENKGPVTFGTNDPAPQYTTPEKNFVDMNGDGIIDAMIDDATYDAFLWEGRAWSDQNGEADRIALLKSFDSYHAVTTQTTNERMIIDEGMVEHALSDVGYFVAPGVTYMDADGVIRDMKFVQISMLFVDRATGDLVRKFATVALDETWTTQPEQFQGILSADGVGDTHIISEHYAHYRDGKKVWVDGNHEILDMVAGVNYTHDGDDVLSTANIVETHHKVALTVDMGAGDDTFVASTTQEAIDGNDGQDTVSYADSAIGVTVTLNGAAGVGGLAEGDLVFNVETLIGSAHDDTLIGSAQDDTLIGGAGEDTLTGGAGADTYVIAANGDVDTITDFVTSVDKIDISAWSAEFLADLTFTTVGGVLQVSYNGFALNLAGYTQDDQNQFSAADFGLSVSSDTLIGTDGNDVINADYVDINQNMINDDGQTIETGDGDDKIYDGAGDDIVIGGAGKDYFYAGAGADTYDGAGNKHDRMYYDGSNGLVIDLTNMSSSTGAAENDELSNIEYVFGTNGNDTIIGDDFVFKIFGRGGDDALISGTRNNIMDGGSGDDTFFVNTDSGADQIRNFVLGADKIDVTGWGAQSLNALNATQINSDLKLSFGSDSILIKGISIDEFGEDDVVHLNTVDTSLLFGTDGDDVINATFTDINEVSINDDGQTIETGNGDDKVYDGAGDDVVIGGNGGDFFYGGAGADTYDGGDNKHDRMYYNDADGIVIDLTDMSASTGTAENDSLTNVEYVFGTNGDDTIIGDDFVFKIFGRSGHDDITSGDRNNIIDVGSGNNIVRLIAGTGYDRIKSFNVNDDKLDLSAWGVVSFDDIAFGDELTYTNLIFGDERIRIDGLAEADFSADNFLF